MGCCLNRNQSKWQGEKLLTRAEDLLGLFTLRSKDIDLVSHRNSFNLKMTQLHFDTFAKTLKIDISNNLIKSFFHQFFNPEDYTYCVRQITALGILLGMGTPQEKILMLFENYDVDSSKSLGRSEISLMLIDISNITFKYSPRLAETIYHGSDKETVDDYVSDLNSVSSTVINYFLDTIFEGITDEISFQQFSSLFQEDNMKMLLSATTFRKFSRLVLEQIYDKAIAVKALINNPSMIDKGILNILESKKTRA